MEEKVKIYLSGPISGLTAEEAMARFDSASSEVTSHMYMMGVYNFIIINPAKLPAVQSSWSDYIIRDLMLLKECDIVFMLPDWERSDGCKIEKKFAEHNGMTVRFIQKPKQDGK